MLVPARRKKSATPKPAAKPSDGDSAPKAKAKIGRPSTYTPELGLEICQRLSEGESILRMCKDDHMPYSRSVRRWVLGTGIPPQHLDTFRQNYDRARLDYQDTVFEELDDVGRSTGQADVPAAKLWSDNTKWSLKSMNRAKFGDRQDLLVGGAEGAPPVTTSSVNVNLANLSPKQQEILRKLARQAIEGAD